MKNNGKNIDIPPDSNAKHEKKYKNHNEGNPLSSSSPIPQKGGGEDTYANEKEKDEEEYEEEDIFEDGEEDEISKERGESSEESDSDQDRLDKHNALPDTHEEDNEDDDISKEERERMFEQRKISLPKPLSKRKKEHHNKQPFKLLCDTHSNRKNVFSTVHQILDDPEYYAKTIGNLVEEAQHILAFIYYIGKTSNFPINSPELTACINARSYLSKRHKSFRVISKITTTKLQVYRTIPMCLNTQCVILDTLQNFISYPPITKESRIYTEFESNPLGTYFCYYPQQISECILDNEVTISGCEYGPHRYPTKEVVGGNYGMSYKCSNDSCSVYRHGQKILLQTLDIPNMQRLLKLIHDGYLTSSTDDESIDNEEDFESTFEITIPNLNLNTNQKIQIATIVALSLILIIITFSIITIKCKRRIRNSKRNLVLEQIEILENELQNRENKRAHDVD